MTVVTAAPAISLRGFARIMALSFMFLIPLSTPHLPKRLSTSKLSALLTPAMNNRPHTSLKGPPGVRVDGRPEPDIAGIGVVWFLDYLTARGRSVTDGRRGDGGR